MKKVLLGLLALVILLVVGAAGWLATKPSVRAASSEKIQLTPERVARGAYLAEKVLGCFDCHSERHLDRYGYPARHERRGGGGSLCWDEDMNLKGFKLCAPNITPDPATGLGAWTDGEIMRAIREGVDRHGQALFPVMPYKEYAALSDEDTRSVVAYLRTIPPIRGEVPERVLPGPLTLIVRLMPAPLEGPVADPPRQDAKAYGAYLATIASCRSCHTPVDDKHQPLPGMDFAGGQAFEHKAFGKVMSANITPHETGIGARSKEDFIALFKSFDSEDVRSMKVAHAQNTVMPWTAFAGMTHEDLGALYEYLRSVPAVAHVVEKRPRPPLAAAPAAPEESPAESPPIQP